MLTLFARIVINLYRKTIGNHKRSIKRKDKHVFCSIKCNGLFIRRRISEPCTQCGQLVTRILSAKRSDNIFCSTSCAAIYNNAHKKHGTRRSKLEIFIEEKLTEQFPNLQI